MPALDFKGVLDVCHKLYPPTLIKAIPNTTPMTINGLIPSSCGEEGSTGSSEDEEGMLFADSEFELFS
jgi:hypothetical protein